MNFLKNLLSILLISSISLPGWTQSQEAYDLSLEMFEVCDNIESLYFEMTKTERVGEDYFSESFRTKLKYNPFMVYSKKIENEKNPELLYKQGEKDNHALVNPDGFPWFNLTLDPMGVFMRKNQHHTLYETGYKYALQILQHLFSKYGEEVIDMASIQGSKTVNERDCWVLEFKNPHFQYISYTVKGNENVLDIAKKHLISEFMIVEINEDVDDYDDVKEGQVIKIPNDYSPRLIISIDKERMVPISLVIYDDKSIFEQFEYSNVKVNPNFRDEEFTEEYESYGF